MDLDQIAPSEDDAFKARLATYLRRSASPGAAVALMRMNTQLDVRDVLPTIQAPTLVLHRAHDRDASVEEGRWIAARIPGAKFVELPGDAHILWAGNTEAVVDEIEEFLTGVRRGPEPDRVLTTVLFTDIAGSTEQATKLGDRRWRELLERHHDLVREQLGRFNGREVDTAGDGFLATFDGPARAIRCGSAVVTGVRALGLEVRAGVHTGECELFGDKVAGLAVHTGARVSSLAGPGEVLVSQTVKDLVAGSGIEFETPGDARAEGRAGGVEALCRLRVRLSTSATSGTATSRSRTTSSAMLRSTCCSCPTSSPTSSTTGRRSTGARSTNGSRNRSG